MRHDRIIVNKFIILDESSNNELLAGLPRAVIESDIAEKATRVGKWRDSQYRVKKGPLG